MNRLKIEMDNRIDWGLNIRMYAKNYECNKINKYYLIRVNLKVKVDQQPRLQWLNQKQDLNDNCKIFMLFWLKDYKYHDKV